MRVTHIEIEKFGTWRNLSLPLSGHGLSVLYGPNETGKTTLLRFVCGVLFGYEPCESDATRRAERRAGWLRVEHHGLPVTIRRVSEDGEPGWLTVAGLDDVDETDAALNEVIAGVNESLFRHVFAIDLHELQELAVLDEKLVRERLYHLSLGPPAQRILSLSQRVDAVRRSGYDPSARSGTLVRLWNDYDEVRRSRQELSGQREQYDRLSRRHRELRESAARTQEELNGIRSDIRSRRFLESIHQPWLRLRECETQCSRLPNIPDFPTDALERLDGIDQKLRAARNCLRALRRETTELQRRLDQEWPDPQLGRYRASLQMLLDHKAYLDDLAARRQACRAHAEEKRQTLDARLAELGPDWDTTRLRGIPCVAETLPALTQASVAFRTARLRMVRFRRRYRSLSARCRRLAASIEEQLRRWPAESLDEAREAARRELTALNELAELKLVEGDQQRRHRAVTEQLQRFTDTPSLPRWVRYVLIFGCATGSLMALIGLITGLTAGWLAGGAYALVAATCLGSSWALARHFEAEVRDRVASLQAAAEELEQSLAHTREEIARRLCDTILVTAMRREDLSPQEGSCDGDDPGQKREARLIADASRRLAELDELARRRQVETVLRQRLARWRQRFPEIRRRLSEARRRWCETLSRSGLPPTLNIEKALDQWQRLADAQASLEAWKLACLEAERLDREWDLWRDRLREMAHRLGGFDVDEVQPHDVLQEWERQLREWNECRSRCRHLRKEIRQRRREAALYRRRIRKLKQQRAALFVRAGVASRAEFEQRAAQMLQRQQLADEIEQLRSRLDELAQNEPELAIVEEHLLHFDAEQNAAELRHLADRESRLQQALNDFESDIRRVEQELESLESDTRGTWLRFRQAECEANLTHALTDWCAARFVQAAIQRVREEVERTWQAPTLASASELLQRLTGGRFRRIFAPLGETTLLLEDEHQQIRQIHELSGGTREQLLLAIRLAVIRELARDGTELPVVLDDVLVNFDHARSEAAADLLIQLAQEGQQILLFTCHLHLVHLFESRGVVPIWLPGADSSSEERRAG